MIMIKGFAVFLVDGVIAVQTIRQFTGNRCGIVVIVNKGVGRNDQQITGRTLRFIKFNLFGDRYLPQFAIPDGRVQKLEGVDLRIFRFST